MMRYSNEDESTMSSSLWEHSELNHTHEFITEPLTSLPSSSLCNEAVQMFKVCVFWSVTLWWNLMFLWWLHHKTIRESMNSVYSSHASCYHFLSAWLPVVNYYFVTFFTPKNSPFLSVSLSLLFTLSDCTSLHHDQVWSTRVGLPHTVRSATGFQVSNSAGSEGRALLPDITADFWHTQNLGN